MLYILTVYCNTIKITSSLFRYPRTSLRSIFLRIVCGIWAGEQEEQKHRIEMFLKMSWVLKREWNTFWEDWETGIPGRGEEKREENLGTPGIKKRPEELSGPDFSVFKGTVDRRQTVKNATNGKTTKGQNEYFFMYLRVRLGSDNFWAERCS